MWGFSSRDAIEQQLAAQGLLARETDVRVRRSWSAQDPDSTIGLARTKQLLGEFAYRVNGDGSVSVTAQWAAQYIPAASELYASIPIRAVATWYFVPTCRQR